GYFGVSVGMKKGDEFKDFNVDVIKFWGNASKSSDKEVVEEQALPPQTILMDTSVIIDGRITDICKTGFIEGSLVVPQFVLNELQHIADSSEPIRRARGKRGLDILRKLQQDESVGVTIIEDDVPGVTAVDSKLVQLARELSAKVLTNDWNLNKVAELQGVAVLNINGLSSALKPVVLPGEFMKLLVVKKGKEAGQGVGYLDDGTMVVIDNAREQIGENVNVEVTSVLQTTGGRMIFSIVADDDKTPVFLHASN
ncbi:MAG: TRAM domain-containing protein, partial [Proteobacteria bacterium]|nr:TRAM domain-containing protein [Pseudomonadota bacterium]